MDFKFRVLMADIMVSSTSIQFIASADDSTFCRKIFRLMAFSSYGKTDSFISYLDDIYDKNNKELVYILNRIIRVFLICNDIDYKQRDRLSTITGISNNTLLLYSSGKKNG